MHREERRKRDEQTRRGAAPRGSEERGMRIVFVSWMLAIGLGLAYMLLIGMLGR